MADLGRVELNEGTVQVWRVHWTDRISGLDCSDHGSREEADRRAEFLRGSEWATDVRIETRTVTVTATPWLPVE